MKRVGAEVGIGFGWAAAGAGAGAGSMGNGCWLSTAVGEGWAILERKRCESGDADER